MVKLVLLATVSLNGTKLTFSLVGLMLICLKKGTQQAIDAGKLIKEAGIEFDQAYTSVLKRAIKTTNLALEASDQLWVPVEKSWRLNERHYGGLTGKNKAEAAEQFGDEQVHIWRRSYDVLPQIWTVMMSTQLTQTVVTLHLTTQLSQMLKT